MSQNARHYSLLDQCLIHLDQGLRTLTNLPKAARASPAQQKSDTALFPQARRLSGRLMRINHSGEISAQALYHAQALTARSGEVKQAMQQAAEEENDHLAWCAERLQQLNTRPSYLKPLWYMGSFAIGVCAGYRGDSWNLGFLAETERQVVSHLQQHQKILPKQDKKSHAIIEQMICDEAEHATTAINNGAASLPLPIKWLMRGMSGVMTKTAYWL